MKTQRERLNESLNAKYAAEKAAKEAHEVIRQEILKEIEESGEDKSLDFLDKMFLEDEGFDNYIKYPIEVTDIEVKPKKDIAEPYFGNKTGSFVSIRPCAKEYNNKTYLGILIGQLPLGIGIQYHRKSGILEVKPGHYNPAIFVPDLNKVIFGCESWWGAIKSEEELRKITDEDINNTWYVRALQEINGNKKASE